MAAQNRPFAAKPAEAGAETGDRVVVDGFQKFVPGDKVKAKAWIDADASVGSIAGPPATQASR